MVNGDIFASYLEIEISLTYIFSQTRILVSYNSIEIPRNNTEEKNGKNGKEVSLLE